MAQSREPHQRQKYRRDNPKGNRSLTGDQKQQIHKLYAKIKNGNKVADILGLGRTTVYKHLGLGNSRNPDWTDDEIQVLVDGYLEKKPVKEIARKLGRSPTAVQVRMCRYRKRVREDPKKQLALRAITWALKAVRKADIFRELEQ